VDRHALAHQQCDKKFGTHKGHLGKLRDVEPVGALEILVAWRKLRLQAVRLDGHDVEICELDELRARL